VSGTFTNTVANYTDLRIAARVPNGATFGPITVVTPHGSVTSSSAFAVLRPQVSIHARSPEIIEITWTDGTAQFVLEESETMESNSWNPVTQIPAIENGLSRVALPVSQSRRFFRVRQK
jgi:hypothetical protein